MLRACSRLQDVSLPCWLVLTEHGIAVLSTLVALRYLFKHGPKKIISNFLYSAIRVIPGAQGLINSEIEKEVDATVAKIFKDTPDLPAQNIIPEKGLTTEILKQRLEKYLSLNADASKGKLWAYVYRTKKKNHFECIKEAHNMFMNQNALNPVAFPGLARFENEVVTMTSNMLGGDSNVRGTMTSGGTESILMAVKTYRDRAKDLFGITEPEMVLPITAHPAFQKASHYFYVKPVYVPIGSDFRVNPADMKKAINKNTILLIASAPQYAHGVVDPISDIAKIALEEKLPLHVDACIGGFMLPWVKKLGYKVPDFDFSVTGVTSISADIHKYGFAAKGASIILYKDDTYRKYQFFCYTEWPGGLFISPSAAGTRAGGPLAAAWASLASMGQEGFLENAQEAMDTQTYLKEEISKIPGLIILGNPHMTLLSFASNEKVINIFAVADVMEDKFDWNIERQQKPDCIHLSIMPAHAEIKDQFIKDLTASVEIVRKDQSLTGKGTAAVYGMVAKISSPEIVELFLSRFLSKVYTPRN